MRKSITICAIASICSMVALFPATTTAMAQAGSTGGTLGKTDKSASGGEERQQEPKHRRRPREASVSTKGDGCGNATGDWDWKWITGSTVTTIRSNGTASQTNGNTGTWVCAEGVFTFSWSAGVTDRMKLSSNGRHFSGNSSNFGVAVTGDRK
jgi:Flp pilus assembly protein TadG